MKRILLMGALWLLGGLSVPLAGFSADQQSRSVGLTLVFRDAESPRGLLPISASVYLEGVNNVHPDEAAWVLDWEEAPDRWTELPFQLKNWRRTGEPGQKPAWTAEIAFFPPAAMSRRMQFRLRELPHGQAGAKAAVAANPLRISEGPGGWTVETSGIRFHLDGTDRNGSGQLAAVTLLTDKGPHRIEMERGVLHRNPDINVLGRPWAHAHKWNPPEHTDRHDGALITEIVRTGTFPGVPEAQLRIRYRFFADRTFMESFTEIEITRDLSVIALRNDQMTFTPDSFSHFGWREKDGIRSLRFQDHVPENAHGDILKLWPDTPWILFWNAGTGVSAGTVRIAETNSGPRFLLPTEFERSTYIMDRRVQSWMRPQVYLNVSWSREAGVHLPAGSRFSEINLYCFAGGFSDLDGHSIDRLYRESVDQPLVEVGSGSFPPPPASGDPASR